MDLNFTEKDNLFREEVRSFINKNLSAKIQKRVMNGGKYSKDEIIEWQKALFKKIFYD